MGVDGLRFAVLDGLRGWRGDRPLDIGPPKQRAVLAALLLRGGRVATAAELIDAVWGDEPPTRVLTALRTYISGLRVALEPDRQTRAPATVLLSVPGGYRLPLDRGVLDIELAEARASAADRATTPETVRDLLGCALALWTGEPLAGIPGPYAARQRARLTDRRVELLVRRLQLDLDLGRHVAVLPELRALSLEQPLREDVRGHLMLALSRGGRQAEALAVYADTRRTLSRELGVEPGPHLVALRRQLAAAEAPARVAPAAQHPRPAQLPAEPADFTGRAGITERIVERLRPDRHAVPLVAISGIAGVGKTTLATHVAHRVLDRFPDGQLHGDLAETDQFRLVRRFLLALGHSPWDIPVTVEQRSALLRTTLAGRRVLVVLDNVRDADQVRPLLPGSPGCAVLIAGRPLLSNLPGATTCRLDVPGPAEALALFTRIVGHERATADPEATAAVLAECGHLPLIVHRVATRVADRPLKSMASVAACLRGGPALSTCSGEFRFGFESLNREQVRALRLLASSPLADLSLPAVGEILHRPQDAAEDVVESLVDLHLLTSPAPGRYGLRDVVRRFADRFA